VTKSQILLAAALSGAVFLIPLALKHRSSGEPARAEIAATAAVPAVGTGSARKLPKLVDLGTATCAPCKAMLVVMGELEQSYEGQLAVEFINVQQQADAAAPYGVRVIPTQVFLDAEGRELFRHTGFLSTEAIVRKWQDLGYRLERKPRAG